MSDTSPQVEIRVCRDFSAIPLDEPTWDRLVEDSGVGGVFLQYFWVSNWWRHFGHSFELFFVTAHSNDEVLAFLPLMIDKDRTLRFIGDLNADYLGLVIPSSDNSLLDLFVEFLGKEKSSWNSIHLRNLSRDSFCRDDFFVSCRKSALHPWNNYSVAAPFLKIESNDEEISALLRKESFRRSERLLGKQGELNFEVFMSVERAAEFWQPYADQHVERCRYAGRASNYSDPAYLPFLKSIFESDRERAKVHFCALFLDDRPIAFHFGFISQNRLLWYKPSFDIGIAKGSPGVTLACNLIRFAQQNSLVELDFTIGNEPFKSRFCSQYRIVDEYRIHKSRLGYLADTGYTRVRRAAKSLVKSGG